MSNLILNLIFFAIYYLPLSNRIIKALNDFASCKGISLIGQDQHFFTSMNSDCGEIIYKEFFDLCNGRPKEPPDGHYSDNYSSYEQQLPSNKKRKKEKVQRTPSTRGRKPGQLSKGNHLWEFLRDLLHDKKYNPDLLKWEDEEQGIFKIIKSEQVAKYWGMKKKKPRMSYEKMSRAIRFCRKEGYFGKIPSDAKLPKKLIFKFGYKAKGWQNRDPNANLSFLEYPYERVS